MAHRYLFVDQGRAVPDAALGHVRVRHALDAGLRGALAPGERIDHVEVPSFTRSEKLLAWHVAALGRWNFGSLRWHLLRGWSALRVVRRELRADPPAAVHVTTDQVGFLLGRLNRRVPCVLSLDVLTIDWVRMKRRVPLDQPSPAHLRPIEVLERRALKRAPLAVAWTETVAGAITRLQPAANVLTLHPGLDVDAFAMARVPRGERGHRVLFVGGRWVAKGGPELVAALGDRLGKDVELDVVTTTQVDERPGLRVHRASPGDGLIPALLAQVDVFCLPTWVDAVPWVVLEAMAAGAPVVSTTVGSIPEMLAVDSAHPCGVVVDPGDVDALREAVSALLADPERCAAMGRAGRERVHGTYDARQNAPKLIEALRRLAAGAS